MRCVLVTGSAGFIGFHLSRRFLEQGVRVLGLDNLNDYYDVGLKKDRLDQVAAEANFTFFETDLLDATRLTDIFEGHRPETVVNLAAQAGVRYSLENPRAYVR